MKFGNLVKGTLRRRYKRFLAEVEVEGKTVVAHCANPGSMSGSAIPGSDVWLSPAQNPKRKLKWTWELVNAQDALVCVHTGKANDLIAEAWENKKISELRSYSKMDREVKVGEKSRLDFMFSEKEDNCYVEVKNVTMHLEERIAAFPDSVTQRGTKHLHELIALKEKGIKSTLLFLSTRNNVDVIVPADHIDPVYGQTLRLAKSKGVTVLGYTCDVSTKEIVVSHTIPVAL